MMVAMLILLFCLPIVIGFHGPTIFGIRSQAYQQLTRTHLDAIRVPKDVKKDSSRASSAKKKEEEDEWEELDMGGSGSTGLKANGDDLEEEDEKLGPQDGDFKSGFVSILGNPNVGKSTLINALLGEQLCIVSPKPQTTRHRILGVLTESNYQLVFSDTPGMIEPVYKLQEAMMDSVRGAAGDADVILLVTDVYGEPLVDKTIMEKLTVTSRPILVVVNKVDLIHGDMVSMIEGAAAATTTTTGTDTSFVSDAGSETLISTSSSMIETNDNAQPNDTDGEDKQLNVVKAGETTKMSFKKKLLLRKALSKAAGNSDSDSVGGGSVDSSSDDADATAEDVDSESYSKSNQPKAFRQSTEEKVDKKPKIKSLDELAALWATRLPRATVVPISAVNKLGIDHVLSRILDHMNQGPKYFTKDTLTNRDERFFAGELIREAIFHTYNEEVPYSCEVVIDSFKDKSPTLSVIEACIVVSKDSQKAILIGKGGLKLKELGMTARRKVEDFLARKVFLSLHVRVDEDWRANR